MAQWIEYKIKKIKWNARFKQSCALLLLSYKSGENENWDLLAFFFCFFFFDFGESHSRNTPVTHNKI